MIVDSTFVIDLMAGDAGALAKLDELVEDAEPLSISALTVTEVRRGLDPDGELSTYDDVIEDVTVVPFDRSEARRAADLLRRMDRDGTPIGALDAMIAATALERREKVLTRNLSEFERVEGLGVSPY